MSLYTCSVRASSHRQQRVLSINLFFGNKHEPTSIIGPLRGGIISLVAPSTFLWSENVDLAFPDLANRRVRGC